ncbi:AbiH family protein [Listeria booriae]|uniref:AbiH family protein n=1 Tax=Listeria booriae TaxID=1552123 RepID=UPI00289D109E|nr:AbiH family protein [Listeria booriae]
MKVEKWENELNQLTFWDLVMIFEEDKEQNINWCNIEALIQHVAEIIINTEEKIDTLDDFFEISEKGRGSIYGNIYHEELHRVIGKNNPKYINKYTIFLSVINSLNDNIYVNKGLDEILFAELQKYEQCFKRYLNNEVTNRGIDYESAKSFLLEKICEEDNDGMILNFNYTPNSFPHVDFADKFKRVNVHGSLHGDVIFGIDHSNVDANSKLYPFTKTFRKLVMDNNESLSVVDKNIRHLVFYGHSLGSADYSYFQSIFDYLNIYENEIYLKFYFSNYIGGLGGEKQLKRELASSVQKLIHVYGETMDNKSKGKNMIHKLLIENRLHITLV